MRHYAWVPLCDPLAERRWLPLLVAGLTGGFLIMRGRSFMDRCQAIVVTVTGVGLVATVLLRFVIELWSPLALVIGLLVLLALPRPRAWLRQWWFRIRPIARCSESSWSGSSTCA
jgi:hypothetical protein